MVKVFLIFAVLFASIAIAQDRLIMVYRTTAKEPFIKESPSNEGVWKETFEKAAKKVGLELEVERFPKKRAYTMLEYGEADFYPAASFKPSREKIGYYIDNQLGQEGAIVLYSSKLDIDSSEEIRGYTLLNNLGSTTTFYKRAGISLDKNSLREVPELDIQRAIELIKVDKNNIYAYSDHTVEHYLKNSKTESIKKLVFASKKPVEHLLFSKKSKYYKEKPNPNYDPSRELSINNLPYMLDENCKAYEFAQALKELKESGEIGF